MGITISNYDCSKSSREKVLKQLQEYGIKYELYNFLYGNGMWFDSGGIDESRKNDLDVAQMFDKCDNKSCHVLADGYIYTCGKVGSIEEIYGVENTDNCGKLTFGVCEKRKTKNKPKKLSICF